MENFFPELGAGIVIATILGIVARFLKQPLVVAYILAGFILGPSIFGIISGDGFISLFSTIGIAFLLFIVGMEISPEKLSELGKKTIIIGSIQVLFTALMGYMIAKLLGFDDTVSSYIGLALSFSSTVIVIKLLSEKKSLQSLFGKLVVGILILQDIFALFALVILAGAQSGQELSILTFGAILIKTILFFGTTYIISKIFLKRLFKYLASSLDILFLASIAWCLGVSGIAQYLGFSIEMGAFLAGLSLASLPFSEEIVLKLSPLRDFFLILFFITLGMQINWAGVGDMIIPLIVLTLFVIFVKSLIILALMGMSGFTKRTSFYTAVSLSQVSEFSLIIASMGLAIGHLNQNIVSLIILITIITILTSSYLVTFLGYIYNMLQKQLGVFERKKLLIKEKKVPVFKNHIILFGYHRLGKQILRSLEKITKKILIVDLDPDIIHELSCNGRYCIYGDAYDPDLLEDLNLDKARMIVTTFPGKKSNAYLIRKAKMKNKKIKIISTADHAEDAVYLYSAGADYVILPHYLSGDYMAALLEDIGRKKQDLRKIKRSHMVFLENYKNN